MNKRISVVVVLLAMATGIFAVSEQSKSNGVAPAGALQNSDAVLFVPSEDYRREWVLLGSYAVHADGSEKGAKELHVVYAEPKSVDGYKKNGVFPDGTVLVKDVFATRTEQMTTGIASYADKLAGRFVMVKDAMNKYADISPLWGDGWGWAFYEGTETRKTVTTDYRKDCLGCHEPARDQDLIYVQGYPILNR